MAIAAISLTVLAAPKIFPVPLNVAKYDQIQQSIIVEVNPGCTRRPATARNPSLGRHISKGAVAIIAVKLISAVRGYIQVFVPIVIVIADSNTHPIPNTLKTSLLRHIFKCAVGFLVIEPVPILGPGLLRNCSLGRRIAERSTVHQEQVEASIVVVVEECYPRAHCLNQILLRSMRSLMFEMHSNRIRHLDKVSGNRGRLHRILGVANWQQRKAGYYGRSNGTCHALTPAKPHHFVFVSLPDLSQATHNSPTIPLPS